MHDQIHITTAAETHPDTWVDGHGTTRELAAQPDETTPGGCIWRVGAIEIQAAGTIPVSDGYDCILMLTDGGALQLTRADTGAVTRLEPGARLYHASETPYTADLPDGPARGFGLTLLRKYAHGCIDLRRSAQAIPLRPGDTILHCAQGRFRLDFPPRMGGPRTLDTGDTLHLTLDYIPAFRLDIHPETPDACLVDVRMNLYPGASRQQ